MTVTNNIVTNIGKGENVPIWCSVIFKPFDIYLQNICRSNGCVKKYVIAICCTFQALHLLHLLEVSVWCSYLVWENLLSLDYPKGNTDTDTFASNLTSAYVLKKPDIASCLVGKQKDIPSAQTVEKRRYAIAKSLIVNWKTKIFLLGFFLILPF